MVKSERRNTQRPRAHRVHRHTPDVADHGSQQLSRELEAQGLYIKDISGDGNCLFRSLSDQLGESETHSQIRYDVVKYLREHGDEFSVFVEEDYSQYVDRMSNDGVYGDNLEIVAFSRIYRRHVKIYQPGFSYLITPFQDDSNAPEVEAKDMLHIVYHSYEHYSSVRNSGGPHDGPPKIRPVETDVPALRTADPDAPPSGLEKICMASVPSADLSKVRSTMKQCNGNINSTIEMLLEQESQDEARRAASAIDGIDQPSETEEEDTASDKELKTETELPDGHLDSRKTCDHKSKKESQALSNMPSKKPSARERREQAKKAQKEAARDRKRKTKTSLEQSNSVDSIIQQAKIISI